MENVKFKFSIVRCYSAYLKGFYKGEKIFGWFNIHYLVKLENGTIGEVFQKGNDKWYAAVNNKLICQEVNTRKQAAHYLRIEAERSGEGTGKKGVN